MYFMILILLIVASMSAWIWQMHIQEYSLSVSTAWSHHLAEQNAFSGMEYALARFDHGTLPPSPFAVELTSGMCTIRYAVEGGALRIEAEGSTVHKGGRVVVTRSLIRTAHGEDGS